MSAPNAPTKSSRPSFQEPSLMTPFRRLNLQDAEVGAPRKLNHPVMSGVPMYDSDGQSQPINLLAAFQEADENNYNRGYESPVETKAAGNCPGAPIADRKRKWSYSAEPINLFAKFQKADENGYDSGYESPVPTKKALVCPGAPMRPF